MQNKWQENDVKWFIEIIIIRYLKKINFQEILKNFIKKILN